MQDVSSRARTVNAGARPERREGSPNPSPGPITSTTSPWWTSSAAPSRTTNSDSAGGPSSSRITSPAAYGRSSADAAIASSASAARELNGGNRARKAATSPVCTFSTVPWGLLSFRFLVTVATFWERPARKQQLQPDRGPERSRGGECGRARGARLRRWGAEAGDELVGRVRDRARRDDPRHRDRSGDGDDARCLVDPHHHLHHDH